MLCFVRNKYPHRELFQSQYKVTQQTEVTSCVKVISWSIKTALIWHIIKQTPVERELIMTYLYLFIKTNDIYDKKFLEILATEICFIKILELQKLNM